MHMTTVRASLDVMTIGPEGEAYLDEHAPQWRDFVRVMRVQAQHGVHELVLRSAPDVSELCRYVKSDLAHAIGDELTKGFESFDIETM